MQKTLKVNKILQRRKNSKYKAVPQLNICGLWLQNIGFQINDIVKITISENQIIITN